MSKIAPFMTKAKAAAEPVYNKVTKEVFPVVQKNYTETMTKNQQYVVTDHAKAAVLHKELFFTTLDRIPKNFAAAKTEAQMWKKTCEAWRECTVKDGVNAAWFTFEVYAFFVVGEIAGRGFTLVDYEVPGLL